MVASRKNRRVVEIKIEYELTDRQADSRTVRGWRLDKDGAEMGSSIKLGKKGWMFGRMFRVPSLHVPVVNTA